VRVGNLLTLNAFVAVGFACGFLLLPATLANVYGVAVILATMFLARIFGAEVLGVGLICWFGENSPGLRLFSSFQSQFSIDAKSRVGAVRAKHYGLTQPKLSRRGKPGPMTRRKDNGRIGSQVQRHP